MTKTTTKKATERPLEERAVLALEGINKQIMVLTLILDNIRHDNLESMRTALKALQKLGIPQVWHGRKVHP